jgi:hypothetical protein
MNKIGETNLLIELDSWGSLAVEIVSHSSNDHIIPFYIPLIELIIRYIVFDDEERERERESREYSY